MTPEQFKQIAPKALDEWVSAFIEEMPRWDINTPAREAAFIAQFAVERREFTAVEENLNYSIAAMMRVWPHRFPTPDAAAPYEHNPQKLANNVYANRMGNGPPESGDGWMYRGRPALTGRDNYKAAGLALALPLEEEPERVCRPEIGVQVDCWFWYSHACNDLSDKGDFEGVTKKLNGGLIGYPERLAYFNKAKTVFMVDP